MRDLKASRELHACLWLVELNSRRRGSKSRTKHASAQILTHVCSFLIVDAHV